MKSSMRPKKLQVHLDVAKRWAQESHARRLKVGAILVLDDREIMSGYNGMPSGMDNECEIRIDKPGDFTPGGSPVYETKPEVVHAEMNVIAFAAAKGLATEGSILITTHSPCFECAKLIKQSKIKAVYYETEYRLTDSIEFLKKAGVEVEKI